MEGTGIELSPGKELPPIRAFMDDLALLNRARELAAAILRRLEELMDWGQLAFKAKKSRSLVLRIGVAGQRIPFQPGMKRSFPQCTDHPVKSLGYWYTDRIEGHEESGRNQGEAGRRSEGN